MLVELVVAVGTTMVVDEVVVSTREVRSRIGVVAEVDLALEEERDGAVGEEVLEVEEGSIGIRGRWALVGSGL